MAAPARKPLPDDAVAMLLDMQRQLGALAGEMRGKRANKARRRGRQRVYSPSGDLPGPQPTALDIARAKRLWREVR